MGAAVGGADDSRRRADARRLLRRHRRLLAGLAAALSIGALGLALQPPAEATRAVVVVAADLAAGQVLGPDDLAVAHVPRGVLPARVRALPDQLVGRALAAPMARGEAIADHRLAPRPAWSVPAGTLPMPVRFADHGAAALLQAGQWVDVVAAAGPGLDGSLTSAASADVVAHNVLVLAVINPDQGSGGILDTPSTGSDAGPLVMLAVDQPTALALAGSQARANLTFLIRPGPS
ncbi:MAG: RcpC/CpaB family pilus assembly protein [Actinomycetota bacterium]|nr:RcpC/CpaB family pilus assembly protein [Actinomycetota bacterium]